MRSLALPVVDAAGPAAPSPGGRSLRWRRNGCAGWSPAWQEFPARQSSRDCERRAGAPYGDPKSATDTARKFLRAPASEPSRRRHTAAASEGKPAPARIQGSPVLVLTACTLLIKIIRDRPRSAKFSLGFLLPEA